MESVLRVAVVGTGVWGEQHARIFARRPAAIESFETGRRVAVAD